MVVHRRLLQSTQMQWDEMVSNKVETLQLMAQIRALMYQLNTAVSSVRELDERCVHFTQRPRRVGSGSFMVALNNGIAMTVRGSLKRKRRRVSNSASSRQAVQAQQIQLG